MQNLRLQMRNFPMKLMQTSILRRLKEELGDKAFQGLYSTKELSL